MLPACSLQDTQKRIAEQKAYFEKVKRQKCNQQKKEALAKAAAEKARAEEEEEEEREEAPPEALAENNAAAIAQACPEPEPELTDDGIFTLRPAAAFVEQLDLQPLNLPAGASQEELAQAYHQMLAERGVLCYVGEATPELLKLLFQTAIQPGLASLAVEASQEITQYFSHLGPNKGPAWVPSLGDFYNALCNLGYRGVQDKPEDHGAQPEGQPGTLGQVAFDEASCLVSLRVWMGMLAEMCALHSSRQGGLLDCLSIQAQEVTVKLILALTELLLCPTVTSCALVQLDACFDALINSWGPGCRTQQGGDSQESTEHVWRGVAMQVAKGVRLIGPNHRARADAVRQLPGCSSRTHLLQQLMAVQLMADVAATWKAQDIGLGEEDLCRVPLQILKSLAPSPSNLCASVWKQGSEKTDFQALLTLFECMYHVLQPLMFQAESVTESQSAVANDVYQYISTLANGLNKSRDGAAVKLCTLLSRMHNALEFGMDLNTHELSHAGSTAD
uniref:Uncharacterized protein n=1 Tax=Dunaliella tertiolecta TaxID=3047 RepID=A0A7S3VP04_DUNTE